MFLHLLTDSLNGLLSQNAVQNYYFFFNQPNFFSNFARKTLYFNAKRPENGTKTERKQPESDEKTEKTSRPAARLCRRGHPASGLRQRPHPPQRRPRRRPPLCPSRSRQLRVEGAPPEPLLIAVLTNWLSPL